MIFLSVPRLHCLENIQIFPRFSIFKSYFFHDDIFDCFDVPFSFFFKVSLIENMQHNSK